MLMKIKKSLLKITFDANEMLMNPQSSLHGGVIATVMDISMGHLLKKTVGEGATIEMKIQYLRPIREGKVTCEGRFIKKGRTLSFMESCVCHRDMGQEAHQLSVPRFCYCHMEDARIKGPPLMQREYHLFLLRHIHIHL